MATQYTLTLPDVAELAGVQVETLRMWYRRNYLPRDTKGGWKRYSVKEAASVLVYAHIVRSLKDHEIAAKCHAFFFDHMAEIQDGFETDGFWVIFYRSDPPKGLAKELGVKGAWLYAEEFSDWDTCQKFQSELLDGTVYSDLRVCIPILVPIHDLWKSIAVQLATFLGLEPHQTQDMQQ